MKAPPPTSDPRRRVVQRAGSIVLLFTGDGKGKTTAAMGTLVRSLARGWKVCVVQFVKSGKWHTGEVRVLSSLGADWHIMGDGFTWESDDLERSAEMAKEAWTLAREAIGSGAYNVVLLDEVTYPVNWGWIEEADVVASLSGRPPRVNVILTGRSASEALIEVADTVSEVRKLKHAYDAGIRAAKGIDF